MLLENCPCDSKDQLHAHETYHIEQLKDVIINKFVPTRTKKEYNDSHKPETAKRWQEYYANKSNNIKQHKQQKNDLFVR